MAEIVILEFGNTVNFTDNTGKVIKRWSGYYEQCIFQDARLVKIAPIFESIKSEWNGQPIDVQTIKWDAYQLSGVVKESELALLLDIKSCNYVKTTTSLNEVIEFDCSSSNYIDISNEYVENSKNSKVTITLRTNKTFIEYQKNTGSVQLSISATTPPDTDFIDFSIYSNLVPINDITGNEEVKDAFVGAKIINRITNKNSYNTRFYLSNILKNNVIDYISKCNNIELIYNYVTYSIIENELEVKNVGIDLYEVNLILTTLNKIFYPFDV